VQLGHGANHLPPSSSEVKKERVCTSSQTKCLSWRMAGLLCFSSNSIGIRNNILLGKKLLLKYRSFVKIVGHNIKGSRTSILIIVYLQAVFCTQFSGMLMMCLHVKFHVPCFRQTEG
jgi:hypothetical protein